MNKPEDKFEDKFEEIKILAEQGNADAQNTMGFLYHMGDGVEQDYAKAVRWYKKAAEQGRVDAQFWADKLTPLIQTQTKRNQTLDFTGKSRLDLLSNLSKEINDVVLSYDGAITLAEAIGVLEIAKIELYNNQTVSNTTTK